MHTYYSMQFERVQKLAVCMYCGDFASSYEQLLFKCNLPYLSTRLAASAAVLGTLLQKCLLNCHFILPGFISFGSELGLRRSARLNTARDVAIIRNYPADVQAIQIRGVSQSFKESFFI